MKELDLTEKYIELKRKHSNFFEKYNPEDRIEFKQEIVSIKTEIDKCEAEIVRRVLSLKINYYKVLEILKENNLERFLLQNEALQNYVNNTAISNNLGFNLSEKEDVLDEFRELCKNCWADNIISSDERKQLNLFCKEMRIDIITQQSIEWEIKNNTNKENLDINNIILYYHEIEGKSLEEMSKIFQSEYRLKVSIDKINQFLISKDLNNKNEANSDDNIIYKLPFGGISVYVQKVDKINSNFNFEISYMEGFGGDFKILIESKTYLNIKEIELIDIIADAISYKNSFNNVGHFLELKPKIKKRLKSILNYS
jgi:hypothetical protein